MNVVSRTRNRRSAWRSIARSIAVVAASAGLILGGAATGAQASTSYRMGCFVITPTTGITTQTVWGYNTCSYTTGFRVSTVSWYTEPCVRVAPNTSGGYKWTKGRKFSGTTTC
ncbi:hypothetical protein GCM10009557_34710 [Virgisporangium ochraceum]|uniref:Uncharacterized protein n=1 Tax=Virgisporangium ochraceum TaxID=65505 RepID=A0A8J4EDK4_9ACTN|nr:hypothetical protein Voc01_029540 [Virgisporangium ochraceum]